MTTLINKEKVKAFFNAICSEYDSHNFQNINTLDTIMQYADVENKDVLDIACGPGVLFDRYHKFHVKKLSAIDISENMIKLCQSKYQQYDIHYIIGDIETIDIKNQFDSALMFNAFPHIANPEKMIENVSLALKENGRFTIAHGNNRKAIDSCHQSLSEELSNKLQSNEEIIALLLPYFDVDISIDNE